jgi:tetratricopeptide (TPR) repeat protein
VELIQKNDFSSASTLLQRAVALAPTDANVHHYLGYALLRTEQVSAAKKEFETACRLNPENSYSEYFLAFIAFSQANFNQAAYLFERLVASGHPVYDTRKQLSLAYMHLGNLSKAMTTVQIALQETPWDGSLHFQLARIYQKMGRDAEAQAEFGTSERLNRADRDSTQELYELSEALEAGQKDRALALRDKMIGHFDGKPELLTSLGILLGDKGLYNEALQPLRLSAELQPKSFEAQFNLGLNLLKLGQASQAEKCLQEAVKLRSDSFQANSTLAVLYINENRSPEAIERLLTAHRLAPEDANILVLLGQQYLQVNEAKKAIPACEEAIKLKPDNPGIWYLLIQAYEKDERYQDALRTAQKAAQLFPSDARSCLEVGYELVNMGHYQDAKPYAQRALQIDTSFVPAYNLLGDVDSHHGDYESALQAFQRARSLAPDNIEARVGIGKTLILLKRYSEALAELQDTLKIHPNSPELYFHLAQVYIHLGKREEAAQASATFRRLRATDASEPR